MHIAPLGGLSWSGSDRGERRFRRLGIGAFLLGRYLYAVFFLVGFWRKLASQWLWTDALEQHFLHRLSAADIAPLQASYLEHFAIPFALPIAWLVTLGELAVGVGLLLGAATRASAALSLFLLINFAAGGFYNPASLPFLLMALLMIALPSGHWLGLDRRLSKAYPDSLWFR